MSTDHPVGETSIGGDTGRGGDAASAVGRWLGLAAAPTFVVMAGWTALCSGPPDRVDAAMRGTSMLSGMTLMYLLMSVFHSGPWVTRIARRRAST